MIDNKVLKDDSTEKKNYVTIAIPNSLFGKMMLATGIAKVAGIKLKVQMLNH